MSIQSIGNGAVPIPTSGMPQRTAPEAATASPTPDVAAEAQKAAASSVASQKVDASSVKQAAEAINSQLRQMSKNIRFSLDEETGNTIVRVVDSDTGQTIRQIPSEEALRIQHSLERLQGVLLKNEA